MGMQDESDCFRELGPGGRSLIPANHVGVDILPNQQVNLEMKRGFCLNILCIGETGIGKTKLLQTLFRRSFPDEPHPSRPNIVSLSHHSYDLFEGNVNLRLNLTETVGYGDQINKTESFSTVYQFLDDQFEAYMNEELKSKRSVENLRDTRVHACLYMITPTGHSLKSWDIVVLKQLDSRVNIIPLIAKADTLTKNELKEFKQKVLEEIRDAGIKIYSFPTDDSVVGSKNAEMNQKLPFAVVSGAEEEMVNGRLCRVRKYPWGTVIIDDDGHCEFLCLREMLLKANLYDLIKVTHEKYYENFRSSRLFSVGINPDLGLDATLRKKRAEIVEEAEEEIKQLKAQFQKDMTLLDEETKKKEVEITAKYQHIQQKLASEDKKPESNQDPRKGNGINPVTGEKPTQRERKFSKFLRANPKKHAEPSIDFS